MNIVTEKNIQKGIKNLAKRMGVEEKELIKRALFLYLENAKKLVDLGHEFLAWDALSDEAFLELSKQPSTKL